ncbi:uncharacterized protein LOC111327299 [Stylophora pistillata]|uniref:uncharacterized protein LOC111327299 n=1 Tax=Stylophora pistillata TaxID=50429 RepID=UPI000C04805C|nr:uncharacterized protein LOC111327299 [Stylophora pistillata]
MDKQKEIEEENSQDFKLFRSRPVTAGGIENGIRFFISAMNALDRIEGLFCEIEQTKMLVQQMIGDFNLAGGKIRLNPEERTKYICLGKEDVQDKEVKRCQKRLKQKRNKSLVEICEELKEKSPRQWIRSSQC